MLQTQNYMAGYLDLLGGRNLICKDGEDRYLNIVHMCYEMAEEMVKINSSFAVFPHSIKIFSDNVIVAIPSEVTMSNDNHPVITFNRTALIMGAFQRAFLTHNILSRGNITYGELYIDDRMVWGKSLIEAYHLESNYANYPRVIVPKPLIYFLQKLFLMIRMRFLGKYFDGEFFLDYLNYQKERISKNLAATSSQTIDKRIRDENDEKILAKFQWHKDYLSSLIDSWKVDI